MPNISDFITPSSTLSGEANVKEISQTAHGFTVGQWVYFNGTTYALTDADSLSSLDSIGVVSEVISTNIFTVTTSGYVSNLSGLTAGTRYFISSTAGEITSNAPINAKAVFIADTTTSGYVQQFDVGASSQTLSNVSLTMSNPNGAVGSVTTTIGSGYNVANLSAVALDVRYDPSGIVNTGNNSFTILTAGTYEIIWGGIVNSTNPTTYLRKNGVRVGGILNVDSSNTASSFVYLAPLVAGDRLEIEIVATLGSMSVTLKQLPTAVAPVVNTVAEYGEQVLTPTTIGAATVDITGGSFTLPSAGTWEVEYFGNIVVNSVNAVG
jgi:hypothetical protein